MWACVGTDASDDQPVGEHARGVPLQQADCRVALAVATAALAVAAALLAPPPATADDAASDGVAVTVLGGPAAAPAAVTDQLAACATGGVTRTSGTDRFAPAAAVAEAGFPDGADAVFVASGLGFADALAAGPAAARAGAPLLLAAGASLPRPTVDALDRLAALACRAVELETGPAERLALGGGVTLEADGPTGTVEVGPRPARVLLDGSAELTFAYPTPQADAAPVTWTQQVTAGAERVTVSQPWRGQRPPATSRWRGMPTTAGPGMPAS